MIGLISGTEAGYASMVFYLLSTVHERAGLSA